MKLTTIKTIDLPEEVKSVYKMIGGFEIAYGYLEESEPILKQAVQANLKTHYDREIRRGNRTKKVAEKLFKRDVQKFDQRIANTKEALITFLNSVDNLKEVNEEIAEIIKENLYEAADNSFESK